MKWVCLLIACALIACHTASAEPIRGRLADLEDRVSSIEEVIEGMVDVTIPKNVELFMDETDPGAGEVKVKKGVIVPIHHCDNVLETLSVGVVARWDVVSGAGVSLSEDYSTLIEGSGSIKITIPAGITGIVKCWRNSGTWNIASAKYLKINVRRGDVGVGTRHLFYGEAGGYVENESAAMPALTLPNTWYEWSWDISDTGTYPDSGQDGVLEFAIKVDNIGHATEAYLWIDYMRGDPGPSQLTFNDGDRIGYANPPYVTTWTGTASTVDPQTIILPRKGQVKAVILVGPVGTYGRSYWATSDMAGGAAYMGAAGTLDTGVISNMGDGTFQVSGNYANKNGVSYYAIVFFAD